MKRALIIGICLVLLLVGCTKKTEPLPVVEEVVEEEEIEVEVVEDLDEDSFKKVKFRVQEELLVFDASRFDEGLMEVVKEDIHSGMTRELAKKIVGGILAEYMDLWKQEIVSETLEFHVGEYSRADFDRLMNNTSNKQIKAMVVVYVIQKLEQDGYKFERE